MDLDPVISAHLNRSHHRHLSFTSVRETPHGGRTTSGPRAKCTATQQLQRTDPSPSRIPMDCRWISYSPILPMELLIFPFLPENAHRFENVSRARYAYSPGNNRLRRHLESVRSRYACQCNTLGGSSELMQIVFRIGSVIPGSVPSLPASPQGPSPSLPTQKLIVCVSTTYAVEIARRALQTRARMGFGFRRSSCRYRHRRPWGCPRRRGWPVGWVRPRWPCARAGCARRRA